MIKELLVLMLALSLAPLPTHAQERPPIIDMHLHTGVLPDTRFALCVPWVTQFPPWDPKAGSWKDIWWEAMTNPPCPDPIWSPGSAQGVMEQTIEVVERRNIIGVLAGTPENVRRWMKAAPGRFIPSLRFKIGRDDSSRQAIRELFENGEFKVLGEISNQYAGIAPNDKRMEPYWALAEELDIPVAIHMGEGTMGTAHMGMEGLTEYRARLSSPYLLEDVLIRHPGLRVSVMHYAAPLVDELIAVLGAHPRCTPTSAGCSGTIRRPTFTNICARSSTPASASG